MNSWINLSALWKIVVVGLLAGAGLPALFAIGLRALSLRPAGAGVGAGAGASGTDSSGGDDRAGTGTGDEIVGGSPLGIAVASLCFAVVLAAIGWGIYSIVNHS